MSKTRDTGFLGNVIKVDTSGNVSFVSGSTTLATINTSGQLSGSSPVLSSSYALNADLLDGLDSTQFTLTSSFAAQTASFTAFSSSINSFSASILSYTASQNITNGTFTTTSSFNAQTASFTAFTASVNSFTASQLVLNGTYATTGSNTFTGIQTINSNLVVTGSITAQTLVVQTVSSSVIYSSGSNVFGNNIANTQTFTGSVLITGSITANKIILSGGADQSELTNATNNDFKLTNSGNFRVINNTNTSALLTVTNAGTSTFSSSVADYGLSIMNVQDSAQGLLVRASDNDTGLYILNLQSSVGATSQTWVNRLVVEKGGNVGIGTATPSYVLDIAAGSNGNVFTPAARISTSTGGAGGGTILQINHTANSVSGLQILQAGASGGNYTSINNTENGYMSFSTSGSERVRISASGSVSIGTTSGTGQALNTANAGVTNTNTYLGTGQLRVGGGSDHGGSTVLSVAPGVVTFDRPGVGGGALTINSSGYVTFPTQPSFYVSSTAGTTSYSSNEVVVFNTARHNTSSCYNTSTGRFTAPVAGRYLFTLNVYAYGGYNTGMILTVNGSQYNAPGDVSPYANTATNATAITVGFALIWELSASDYVEVRSRGTSQIYRMHSHFSGQLLS
jgi:hypothetical protein